MASHKHVGPYPTISLSNVFSRHLNPHNYSQYVVGRFTLGRGAIYWALKGLHFPTGTKIWMPSFHCGVEIQAAIDSGFSVSFFRIKKDLTIDLNDLYRKIKKEPGPILLIHYYGYGQPEIQQLSNFCKRQKIPLIEDCTHALFSFYDSKPLGSFAPISIFSLYKIIGTIDGGELHVNQPMLNDLIGRPLTIPIQNIRATEPVIKYVKTLSRKFLGQYLTKRYRTLRFGNHSQQEDNIDHMLNISDQTEYTKKISFLSECLLKSVNPETIISKRRRNWLNLHSFLESTPGYNNAFKTLPEGTSPFQFPIFVQNRNALMKKLQSIGIETYVFGKFYHPTMNVDSFPETTFLRNHILCLPIHQGLTTLDIEYIASKLSPMLEEHALY